MTEVVGNSEDLVEKGCAVRSGWWYVGFATEVHSIRYDLRWWAVQQPQADVAAQPQQRGAGRSWWNETRPNRVLRSRYSIYCME